MGKMKDITGQRFGLWTVIKQVGKNAYGAYMWECVCDCGTIRQVAGSSLRNGCSKCCGCLAHIRNEQNKWHETHAGKKERLYGVYRGIIKRCENKNDRYYDRYGGRGIKICDEWRNDYAIFREWAYAHGYDDTANKYECTIERVDNDKDYCPENCIWTSMIRQCNNRSSNHLIEHNGDIHTISEWSLILGIRKDTIRRRIVNYHWSVDRALTEPVHAKHKQ